MSDEGLVTIDVAHGIADVRLNRPEALQSQLIGSPNQIEAITANFEKRPPNFNDPE